MFAHLLCALEESIIQTKSKSSQDPHPIKLIDKIGALAYAVDGDHAPTAQSREVFEFLAAQLDEQLQRPEALKTEDIPAFNGRVIELRIPSVILERERADVP